MLNAKTRWDITPVEEDKIQYWQDTLGVSSLVAKMIIARGWDEKTAREMLELEQQSFHDPFLLDDMRAATDRIIQAIQNHEFIRIYGDYDCDGVSSTSLLYHVLNRLDAQFDYYIPNRFTEGYGLNKKALDLAKEEGVQLIITVDTGISSKEVVAYGVETLGLDFVITDHHEPPPELPQCTAVINPKKPGCQYPYPYLAGAGVTLKLAHALLGDMPRDLLDIATVGTVADLVPLTGENRLIVHHGLKMLNRTQHVGLQALIKVAGIDDEPLNEEHVGFTLGPRINASGRIATADQAVDLLISSTPEEAELLAAEIDQLNAQRQKLVEQMTKEAIAWVEDRYTTSKPKVLVVAEEDWNVGVIGIVASKLVERYYVPTIVLSIDREKGLAKGSARSIHGFDMYQALRQCVDILPHFGGHPMAAGMTLEAEHVDDLRTRLDQLAEQWLTEEDYIPITSIDLSCTVEEITLEAIEELNQLAPFGVEHPRPHVLLETLQIKEFRPVGAHQNHLKCKFTQEDTDIELEGIGFYLGEAVHQVSPTAHIDIVGQVDINEWNGRRKPQIQLKDLRVTARQYFDWRAPSSLEKNHTHVYFDHKVAVCVFRPTTFDFSFLDEASFHILRYNKEGERENTLEESDHTYDTIIFFDLPYSKDQLQKVCQDLSAATRLYMCFYHQENHFFSTLPSRDHFKWYFAFLQQQGPFDIDRLGEKLAKHKGWTLESIKFMTDVFLELGFATMSNGQISLVAKPVKKELETSSIYKQKQEDVRLEQAFIYSSFQDLILSIEELLKPKEKKEEALPHGF
ncbi:single-stranded-DNA-specific exonuclease RecJ [Caldalkalibacillus salinus]|uniref:single-stranded-DNA-specific exonuclease RecJ n=1 Tax=Caldalkalibacillus salinus TaxID=2803787 RepID=UPI0030191C1C